MAPPFKNIAPREIFSGRNGLSPEGPSQKSEESREGSKISRSTGDGLACRPCQTAKTRCDRIRPRCGRCVLRNNPTCEYDVRGMEKRKQVENENHQLRMELAWYKEHLAAERKRSRPNDQTPESLDESYPFGDGDVTMTIEHGPEKRGSPTDSFSGPPPRKALKSSPDSELISPISTDGTLSHSGSPHYRHSKSLSWTASSSEKGSQHDRASATEIREFHPLIRHNVRAAGRRMPTRPSTQSSDRPSTVIFGPVQSHGFTGTHQAQFYPWFPVNGSVMGFGNLPMSSAIRANHQDPVIQEAQIANLSVHEHLIKPLQIPDDSQLSELYTGYFEAVLSMIIDGTSAKDIIDQGQINVELLFRDRKRSDGFEVSTFNCEWMKSLEHQDFFAILAAVMLDTHLIRWMLFPTADQYSRIPEMIRPTHGSRVTPHPPGEDLIPFPIIREALLTRRAEWVKPVASLQWPYTFEDALFVDPETGARCVSKAFEEFAIHMDNWTFDEAAFDMFPELRRGNAKETPQGDDQLKMKDVGDEPTRENSRLVN